MSAALLVLLTGCTLQPGTGFATLTDLGLWTGLDPGPGRDLGDGQILSDRRYVVEVEAATLTVEEVALVELVGSTTTFDPANPPEGYSLCHGGHCHRDDGALVDYADIEAELAGEQATFEDVVAVALPHTFDWVAGEQRSAALPAEGVFLPAAEVRRVSVRVERLALAGWVSEGPEDGGLGDAWLPLVIDLAPDQALEGAWDLTLDRDSPETLAVDVVLAEPGTLFDGLDFADLAVDGAVSLQDPDDPGVDHFLSQLVLLDPTASLGGE